MADVTLRSIYSAADETIAQLDRLQQASRDRALTMRQSLDAAINRLGDSTVPYVDALGSNEAAGGPVTETSRRRPQPVAPETPYVPLPERSTHGGPFGPAVRAKLIREALAKDTRW
jgi:hypothetical protein